MLRNYLTVAARVFARSRLYTALSVTSLTIAFAAALLVVLYAEQELSYDRFHERAGDLYRLVTHSTNRDVERSAGFVPLALAPHLEDRFASVEGYARVWEYRRAMPVTEPESGATFYEDDFGWAERSFFDLFDFEVVAGDLEQPLRSARSVVISESAAARYFGEADPVGKTLLFRAETDIPLEVTAVMRDFPTASHLHFDFVANIETAEQHFWAGGNAQGWLQEWENLFVGAYLLMQPGADLRPVLAEATEQVNDHLQVTGSTYRIEAQAVPAIHLTSQLDVGEFGTNGSLRTLYAVLAVGLIILLLGCFNFINLVTAQAGQRMREVGVRKTIGGTRPQLVAQYYLECLLLVGCAFVLSLVAVEGLRPWLRDVAPLGSVLRFLLRPAHAALVLVGLAGVTALAGAYPALLLSRFDPAAVLKGATAGAGGRRVRRVMVTTQFALSAGLIVCTLVVYQQLQHMKQADLGFRGKQVVVVPIHDDGAIIPNIDRLKAAYAQDPRILGVTASSHLPMDEFTYQNTFVLEGTEGPEVRWERYTVEGDYPAVYDLSFLAGRSFRPDAPADTNAVILNERAVRELGLTPQEVVGRQLANRSMQTAGEVVGVVADFHFQSLREAIQPFVLVHRPEQVDYLSIRVAPEGIAGTLDHLEATWRRVMPDAAFGYTFLDETFGAVYAREEHLARVVLLLSGVALFLAALGLFGLSMYATERRTKEIGIRKVLGASAWDVLRLLGGDFTRLVALALLVAFPAAYALMHRWLSDFAYRIEMPVLLFVTAGAGVLVLAWAAMSYQSIRAVRADPVKSLRVD